MRQFLALALSEQMRRDIGRIAPRLPALGAWRWIAPASVHLTLRFLGEVGPDLDEVARPGWARAAAGVEPFCFRLGRLGCFPRGGQPRVLWVAVREQSGRLAALAAALEQSARDSGFVPVERAFRPHLTLARVRGSNRGLRPDPEDAGCEREEKASEVVLFRSLLGPDGARYTALASFPLGGRGDRGAAGDRTGARAE